jgi:hypothetical protein
MPLQKKDPEIYDDKDVKDLFANGTLNKTTNTSKVAPQQVKEANTTTPSPAPSKTPPVNVTIAPSGPNQTANAGNKKAPEATVKAPAAKDNTTSPAAEVGLEASDVVHSI